MNFIRIFTRRPVTTIMLFGMLLLFGGFSYFQLAKDLFPTVDVPYVLVTTVYPGAGPEEVESQITEKIEEALASVSGLKSQSSTSMEGASIVLGKFDFSVDGNVAEADVRSQVDQVINALPDDAYRPTTAQMDINALPISQVAVVAPRAVEDIYQIVDELMVDRLRQIQGVAKVDVTGGKEREILISVSSKKLEAFGLSILDLDSLVSAFNLKLPAGRITEGQQEMAVKLQGEFPSAEAIEQLEIPTSKGVLRLTDVATVEDTYAEVRSMARMNGSTATAVGLSITKSSTANTVAIMKQIRKELQKLGDELPEDFELILAKDGSTTIEASINDVFVNLGLGILLTAGVLFIFLHNFRLTLIATITLPIAVVATFGLMFMAGFTANMMSLMALALSVGILVANVIVVLENIQRHLRESGDTPLHAAERGTAEIVLAVVGSALTNMAVFLPLATAGGIAGKIFPQFGFTTIFATLFSLLLSFTLTPMLASRMLKQNDHPKGPVAWFGRQWEKFYGFWETLYAGTLTGVLRFRWLALLAAFILFVGSLTLMKYIGGELIPATDQGLVQIQVEKAVDESLEGTSATVALLEERLEALPYVEQFYTTLGGSEGSSTGVNEADITVTLVDREQRQLSSSAAEAEFRRLFADIPGAQITVQAASSLPGGSGKPISVSIRGQNMDDLLSASQDVLAVVKQTPGTVEADLNWRLGKTEIQITPDYLRCADYGITSAQLAMMLRTSFAGSVSSQYRVDGKEYDIRVQLAEEERTNASDLNALPIQTPKGMVRLDALARVEFLEGPSQIYREDRMRSVTVGSNLSPGVAVGTVQSAIQQQVDTLQLPQSVSIKWGGDTESMVESFTSMGIALVLSIALTYMLLAMLLESTIHALALMSTLPLALIGVLVGLFVTGSTLNLFSIMGVIMLVGIVVNNGIILFEYIEELRKEHSWREILVHACRVKLRPILMTNTAIAVSMLPMALGLGQGGEMRAPMAIVAIGGILSSTFMTLYLIPVLYSLIEGLRDILAERRQRKHSAFSEPAVASEPESLAKTA